MRILILLPLLWHLLKNIILSSQIHSFSSLTFLVGKLAALYSAYKSLHPICEVHKSSYAQNLGPNAFRLSTEVSLSLPHLFN